MSSVVGSGGVPTTQSVEKRSRLFRSSHPGSLTTSGGVNSSTGITGASVSGGVGSKKKQTLSLGAEASRSMLETCLSPTNVEPRKQLLDQLSKIFSNEESGIPEVVTIATPPEALNNSGCSLAFKLTAIFTSSFKPAFVPHNTAEIKAILQAVMAKIQK